jgi:hypothetical protein
MEKLLKNQQIPLTQVIDPNTGQIYYSPQNVVYDEKNNNGPQYLRNVIVDQALSASYFSGSITNAISASYALTASYFSGSITNAISASYALTSSFATRALSASYAANGGVTQLLAGPNITLSPIDGLGQVTVSATLSGSTIFNTATGSYGSFYDTTTQTNPVANVPRSMSFNSTDITNGVSISGSTNPFNTYIKTTNAGVYNIQFSAQVDKTDGGSDDIVIWLRKNGIDLTDTATTLTLPTNNSKVVAAWNWFVSSATGDYYQIIWRSADTDLRLLAESISVDHPGIPSVIVTANRVDQFLSNTGSFSGSFTGVFTGLFSGSVTAPGTTTQVVFNNGGVLGANSGFVYSGSRIGIGTTTPSASLHISGASSAALLEIDSPAVNNILYVSGSGNIGIGTGTPTNTLDIQTTSTGSLRISGSAGSQITLVRPTAGLFGYVRYLGTNMDIGTNSSDPLRLNTTNVTRIQILETGLVGIGMGTLTPSSLLQVRGSGTTSATTALRVENSSAVASLIVLDNRNVGIGTTTPSASLHISGASSAALLEIDSPTANNILFVTGSGRIGVGTNIPITTLDISGSGRFTNDLTVTGSLIAPSITGSLLGTSSFATSASIASTASYVLNAISASRSISSSYALTASFVPNAITPSGGESAVQFQFGSGIAGSNRFTFDYNNNIVNINNGATLNATGSLLGTSSFATQALTSSIAVTALTTRTSTNATYFPIFVDSSNGSAAPETLWSSTGNITINPSLGSVSATSFTGSLTGSVNGAVIDNTAWVSYTPSWTANSSNPVIGNGTITGQYKVIGKTCFVRGNIVMGSTTTFGSGEWYVSMPFTASHADAILMTANLLDNGSAWYNAVLNGARAGFNFKTAIQYQATGGTANDVNSTQPFTWANSDRFLWNGSYEIA